MESEPQEARRTDQSNVTSWVILITDEVAEWLDGLIKEDPQTATRVGAAITVLKEEGPALPRPLVDQVKGSSIKNLKELRPGSTGRSKVRILFVFDPWRQAILLVAGDKSTDWKGWYRKALKDAERLYAEHLHAQELNEGRHPQAPSTKQAPSTTHVPSTTTHLLNEGIHDDRPKVGRGKGRAVRRPRRGATRR
jgi:hypothetical protein